jgi:PIN domain nuclease of toxin-antitoxin system
LDVGDPKEWLRRASKAPGIGVIQVDRETLVESALLDFQGRDPADRILIATALRYDLRIVTADEAILDYAQKNRRLAVLDARP